MIMIKLPIKVSIHLYLDMKNVQIDRSLNPDNCEKLGFEWQYDTIFDPQAPEKANEDFVGLINQGWKLERPGSRELEKNGGVGDI